MATRLVAADGETFRGAIPARGHTDAPLEAAAGHSVQLGFGEFAGLRAKRGRCPIIHAIAISFGFRREPVHPPVLSSIGRSEGSFGRRRLPHRPPSRRRSRPFQGSIECLFPREQRKRRDSVMVRTAGRTVAIVAQGGIRRGVSCAEILESR